MRPTNWQTSKSKQRLSELSLQALKAQLQLHFLFNAFNTVAVLMHEDVNLAHQISLEQRLDPAQFTRIAHSSIVNINSVLELQSMFNGDFVAVLKNGGRVNGSRCYREALDALLN